MRSFVLYSVEHHVKVGHSRLSIQFELLTRITSRRPSVETVYEGADIVTSWACLALRFWAAHSLHMINTRTAQKRTKTIITPIKTRCFKESLITCFDVASSELPLWSESPSIVTFRLVWDREEASFAFGANELSSESPTLAWELLPSEGTVTAAGSTGWLAEAIFWEEAMLENRA